MIRFINFLFLVCHIYFNWNERTLTYTPFHEFLILSAIKSVFRYWMRQLLKPCFVPKQNHLILLCYWTHHVIHEINTLSFSSNSKTRFIFTFILYLYDSLTVVCCIWREWRHWLWDCVGTSTRCRRRHGRRSWGWDVGRDVVSSTSCSGVSCSYAISTINFSSFFGQSREKLVGALVGWL